jgi:hypothetical protein
MSRREKGRLNRRPSQTANVKIHQPLVGSDYLDPADAWSGGNLDLTQVLHRHEQPKVIKRDF